MRDEIDRRLTRRHFVAAGAAAAVAAGAGALVAVGPARVYHRLTRDCGPAGRTPARRGSSVVNRTFEGVRFTVVRPRGARAADRLPVCYCLPGRGDGAPWVVNVLRLDGFLHEAVEAGARPFALAALSGGESYWHPRRSGENRLGLLLERFIPFVEAAFSLGPTRALAGWSMGGYGALLAATEAPDAFAAVVATSPALWTAYDDAAGGAFDSRADFERHDLFARAGRLRTLALRIDCGESDPFLDASRAFAARVPHAEVVFASGCHDSRYWRRVAPDQLEFLATALA